MTPSPLRDIAQHVKLASRALARASTAQRNSALTHMATQLRAQQQLILTANAQDVLAAKERGLDDAFIDRLTLSQARIEAMASAIEEVALLPDPIGGVDSMWQRPNGLMVGKKRIPLGVIAIIYESRPNVTSDAAALCLKSGNGVLLKGGSDAFASNKAIHAALAAGLEHSSLPPQAHRAIGFVPTTERAAVKELLGFADCIDLVIPRGGKGLIRFVSEHARMPVIKHDEGICHVVVDASAPAQRVTDIVLNAKTQRPGVCNAAETILVLESAVAVHLENILTALSKAHVIMHLCARSMECAKSLALPQEQLVLATEDDWGAEYLALEVALRVVPDLDAAIAHIDTHGSSHTEALVTSDWDQSQRFIREVDSAVVVINASTRFADGAELGLGAEIGISTTRMHAYGPMGLRELTATKFIVTGQGHIRS